MIPSSEKPRYHAFSARKVFLALRSVLRLLTTHLVVALVALVVIGGATRVMEAGLACPDWPLCYGSLLPGRQMNLQVFLEWFHRLDAFLVGIALLVVLGLSVGRRKELPPGSPGVLPLLSDWWRFRVAWVPSPSPAFFLPPLSRPTWPQPSCYCF